MEQGGGGLHAAAQAGGLLRVPQVGGLGVEGTDVQLWVRGMWAVSCSKAQSQCAAVLQLPSATILSPRSPPCSGTDLPEGTGSMQGSFQVQPPGCRAARMVHRSQLGPSLCSSRCTEEQRPPPPFPSQMAVVNEKRPQDKWLRTFEAEVAPFRFIAPRSGSGSSG